MIKPKSLLFCSYCYFACKTICLARKGSVINNYQLHPLVDPHVSHFSHVPLRTMVKLWHSEHSLPV